MASKTVLVVDPHPATHRKVDEAFYGTEFDVLHARRSSEASEALDGRPADLVLSATSLPDGNGYDLARSLRERFPAALIYLLAGGFDVYDAARAEESGVDARIPLPFTPSSLLGAVESALGPLTVIPLPTATAAGDDVPTYAGLIEISAAEIAPLPSGPAPLSAPPSSDERLATFLPRDYRDVEPVVIDPSVVMPGMEQAILEVLPEVVEGVLRSALTSSPTFRRLVATAVEDAVAEQLPSIVERISQEQRAGK